MFGAQRNGVFEEESEVGQLGMEAGEERGESAEMGREVLVATAMVVVEVANITELEGISADALPLCRLLLRRRFLRLRGH